MKAFLLAGSCLALLAAHAQVTTGRFIADKHTGCQVWVSNGYTDSDSLTINWTGGCLNNMAAGKGTLTWYTAGRKVSTYTGSMQKGNPNGQGKYVFPNGFIQQGNFVDGLLNGHGKVLFPNSTNKLEGHFVNGELLDLDSAYLKHLHRNVIAETDSTDMYMNDGNSKSLLYYALVPPTKAKGVLVLLPGTWDRVEYVISSNRDLCQRSFNNGIAVLVLSVNQRLTLNTDVLDFMNHAFVDAIKKYQLPKDKFVLGGFSMGGLFSIRYTEMAYADGTQTAVVPKAVYSVDGPTDLENHYWEFEKAHERNPNNQEPIYAIAEFKKNIGGPPTAFREKYIYYSTFSKAEKDGGNAKYLQHVPVRIYNDVDVNWWIINRGADLYDMNALDQSAMINFLIKQGNKQASFINAYGKGYRLEGNRHPHSWSIVDAPDCVKWIKECIE